jgi:serine/threonine protein kinase
MLLFCLLCLQLAREVCLHMRSCHPFIASLYAAYKDPRHIYLLMELAPSGNLYQMLMALPVPAVSAINLKSGVIM